MLLSDKWFERVEALCSNVPSDRIPNQLNGKVLYFLVVDSSDNVIDFTMDSGIYKKGKVKENPDMVINTDIEVFRKIFLERDFEIAPKFFMQQRIKVREDDDLSLLIELQDMVLSEEQKLFLDQIKNMEELCT